MLTLPSVLRLFRCPLAVGLCDADGMFTLPSVLRPFRCPLAAGLCAADSILVDSYRMAYRGLQKTGKNVGIASVGFGISSLGEGDFHFFGSILTF